MEAGNTAEGRRWLLYALQDEQLDDQIARHRLYLAGRSCRKPHAETREYFEAALEADPTNDYAQDSLRELMKPPSREQPPVPPPTLPEGQNNPLVPPKPPAPIYVPM